MIRIFFIISFICSLVFSYELRINSNVTALKLDDKNLYIGTDSGEILLYTIDDKVLSNLIALPSIENFYGKSAASIFSMDVFKDNLSILSESSYGKKDVHIYKNATLKKIGQKDDEIKKVFFIDDNILLVVYLGSEIILYDLTNSKITKSFKFSHSSLNDAVLSKDRKFLVAGFESGEIEIFDIKKWALSAKFSGVHKDNIYQVDYKNNVIVSCGTDRRIGIIKNGKENFLQKTFLMYDCALNPSGSIAAFSDNSTNVTELVDTSTLSTIVKFDDINLLSEFIVFINDNEFIIAGYGDVILFRSVK
ncbi:WD40 repeat domain-containing protein [Campylobacter sp. LR264d]|uniref:WD40 repeat domain-containing protein n=1 Tax=unclassified Campylobacter TaxID=2593542 RepID=UPI0012382612|nr:MULTISPECIES: WD40 repeat domain-containing protein [unclassified Campylobacter]KAA6227926.1 WD40 repeat domain-containing protein [Campylobacter sp. LR185c]KAA6231142.1 WD40 repeat domain-containing protein [Campylobacter sp. LR264d]KAA8604386.1 napL protein [Campylobacter sp. LR185c]